MFVADASVILDWMLPGQASPAADRAWRLAGRSILVVPALWLWETRSVVLKLQRQRRITGDDVLDTRLHLSLLNKRIDEPPSQAVIDATWEIAEHQMLSFYDAAYLELSLRLNVPLASSDSVLCNAAKKYGVRLV